MSNPKPKTNKLVPNLPSKKIGVKSGDKRFNFPPKKK